MKQLESGKVRRLNSSHLDFPTYERSSWFPMVIIELSAMKRTIR